MKKKRPNILLITSDQQRWDTLGKTNPILKTPNLDRLADEGILFERAYACNPVCTPNRVSILTGQYPSRHGCHTIGTSLPEGYPTLAELMNKNGYFTGICGKAHFQACALDMIGPNNGFESEPFVHNRDFFRSWTGPYYGFEHACLCIGHSTESKACGMHYGVWLDDRGVDTKKYFGNTPYHTFGVWDLPEEFHNSKWTADITIEAIEKAKKANKPFFIWSSFQDPHNPCYVPEPWASMYDPSEVPDYRYREGEHDQRPPFYNNKYFKEDWGINFGPNNWHCVGTYPKGESERKRCLALYYGMVSLMDKHIGRIIDYLKQSGQYENTLIIFTSDHGDYMGNHGFWWKGLPAFEDIHKVPFIVKHPQIKTRGQRSQSFQSLVDIARSFLEIADIEPPPLTQGINQNKSWQDANASVREAVDLEWRPCNTKFMQKVFWHYKYKIVFYSDTNMMGELYDIENDPDQYVNLWNEPSAQKIKNELALKFIAYEMSKDGVLRARPAPA